MKNLDLNSTKIFSALMAGMNGRSHHKFIRESLMPLTIENMGGHFPTMWGDGLFYSLCHYYEQQGDLMQDPEMCFLVVDNRKSLSEFEKLIIVPCSYQNASLGIYEESISFMSGRTSIYLPIMHRQHISFAQIWMGNILQQGFIGIES
ncbi:DUF6908 domain-containing protein [Pedobacter paludis]|uniref:DUF6908 domain-containing protein n=1 Tax=Pedobacter paludis TaxID=2203212 RepID=A0A317F400_9SPHI|nr:hypothetical protein [Pedobacter paludis]PWS33292.1 hypothetical protein DF947_01315 [Pedobacter paludis]